jgi:hypothetical protein
MVIRKSAPSSHARRFSRHARHDRKQLTAVTACYACIRKCQDRGHKRTKGAYGVDFEPGFLVAAG